MRKRVSAIMNTIKKNRKGFTIIELITAIGILAILGGSVGYAMTTSSKTYNKLSVEAQLQSEAQMVANMITELAIDSLNASNKVTNTLGMDYDETEGKILLLESALNGVKKQYVIGRKASENKIYLAERAWDTSNKKWKDIVANSDSLLGEYITGFTVDTSRVEEDNVLMFKLSYTKNGKTYDGNYQVLMRNRAYANKNKVQQNPKGNAKVSININPELVYINIKKDQVEGYYEKDDDLTQAPPHTLTSSGVPFTVTVTTNLGDNPGCKWELLNEDEDIFEMSSDKDTEVETINLTWDKKKKPFKDSPVDAFKLVATKTITLSDGSDTIDANPKLAQILLRRIKSLTLYAISGTTQWKDEFETIYEGVPAAEAHGYAFAGTNGKYLPINLNASLLSSNIAYGGGLSWKLYMKNTSGGWNELGPTDSAYAALANKQTTTSTSNTVTLGSSASNGQIYKVVVTSDFDDSFYDEYIFGVAPNSIPERDGYNSRGFYTSMNAYWKGKSTQSDHVFIDEILWMECIKVSGGNLAEEIGVTESNSQVTSIDKKIDKIKIIKDDKGVWRLYVDFDAFAFGKQQKETFYSGAANIYLVALYRGVDGKYYMAGNDFNNLGDFKNFACAQAGISPDDIQQSYSAGMEYKLHQVTVTKVEPTKDVIVIQKGKDKVVDVKTSYYNLVSPRRGAYYLGVFIDDMDTNLMQDGMETSNAYFDVHMTSQYGDTDKYVDEVVLNVVAKANQKKCPTDPLTLRVTANDYYMINPSGPNSNSYTDYKVLVANVEGTDAYIPGPSAKASGLAWPAAADTAKTEVTGYNSTGDTVKATVYKSGNGYYCMYAGRKYTYSATLGLWKK